MKNRNYSLDFLRLLAMFMVVTLHVLGHGGLLSSTIPGSSAYYTAWLMEALALCAVNCYGILSGYIGVDGQYRYTNIILLWLQVAFYSIGITLLLSHIGKIELTSDILKASIFPVIHGEYWYFTAYVGLFFFIPIVNTAISSMTTQQLRTIFITCIIIFCLLPTYFHTDPFALGGGYNFVWLLLLLYIIGGCINKGNLFSSISCWLCGIGYLFFSSFAWIFKLIVEKNIFQTQLYFSNPNLLMEYTAPSILFAAIFLFMMFKKIHMPSFLIRVIKTFSPAAFGVYLIHDNRKIREFFISGISAYLFEYKTTEIVFEILIIVVKIYLICLCIDFLRHNIFRFLKIKELLYSVEKHIFKNLWDK